MIFFALGSHMSVVDDMLPIVNNGIVFMHGEEELHAMEEKWGMLIDIREIPSLLSPLKVKSRRSVPSSIINRKSQFKTNRGGRPVGMQQVVTYMVYFVVLFLGGKPQTIV